MNHALEDCWNRIGVQGDRSCAELSAHIHCRNCPVYSAAARQLLDVPRTGAERRSLTQHIAEPRKQAQADTRSAIIFRASAEWFALPTTLCVEVAGTRAVRTLPHRRSEAVLGLANVRGELIVCVSLGRLLGLPPARTSATLRLLIVRGESGPTALQVDEVHGTHRYIQQDLKPAPDTLAVSSVRTTSATLRWRDRTVGLLEGERLLAGLDRCIA